MNFEYYSSRGFSLNDHENVVRKRIYQKSTEEVPE